MWPQPQETLTPAGLTPFDLVLETERIPYQINCSSHVMTMPRHARGAAWYCSTQLSFQWDWSRPLAVCKVWNQAELQPHSDSLGRVASGCCIPMRLSGCVTKWAAWYSPLVAGLCLTWVVWVRSCEQGILPLKSGDWMWAMSAGLQCCTMSHSGVWLRVCSRLCGLRSLLRAEPRLNCSPRSLFSRDETKAEVTAGKVLLGKGVWR